MSTAKDFVSTLKETGPKTSAYDTTATVIRIEGQTAWVHIPGGVSETPASMTIDAKPGDTVQVRVSGGRAFLVGNSTAPPTDDTKANKAKTEADEAKNTASKAKETADGAKDSADSAIHLAEGINEHFWHDSTGAHITEDTQEDYQADPANAGGNTLITSQGMAVRRGQTELAVFSADGAKIGMDGGSRIEIESGGTKVFNEDSVLIFDVNAKGGSTRQRKTETIGSLGNNNYSENMRIERNSLSGASSIHAEIDLSGLSTGTSVVVAIDSFTVESTGGTNFSGANPTLNGFALLSQTGRAFTLFFIAQSFTVGTDYTGYATASFPTTSTNGMATIGLTIDYDSSIGILSIDIGGAQAVVSDVTYIRDFYTTCRAGYYVTTAAPAYTLGVRDAEQTPGDFSCVIGERLYADSGHQLAIGKYNIRDAADKYPLIVGNGFSDSARSNALTVDWDGNVDAAGTLIGDSGNYLTAQKSFTNTSERISLSSSTTDKTVLSVTAPKTGYVIVSGFVTMTTNNSGNRHVTIDVGGTKFYNDTRPAHATNNGQMGCCAICRCHAGETIAIQAWQTSGATLYAGGRIDAVFL